MNRGKYFHGSIRLHRFVALSTRRKQRLSFFSTVNYQAPFAVAMEISNEISN